MTDENPKKGNPIIAKTAGAVVGVAVEAITDNKTLGKAAEIGAEVVTEHAPDVAKVVGQMALSAVGAVAACGAAALLGAGALAAGPALAVIGIGSVVACAALPGGGEDGE